MIFLNIKLTSSLDQIVVKLGSYLCKLFLIIQDLSDDV